MHKLIDYICDELEELERKADKDGKLSMAEIQYMDTLAHAKKNLMKADEMSEDGYSNRGYSRGRYYVDGSYNDGRSYARGRRRDSMGRYSRGYSMANDEMVSELRSLMNDAPDEHTRKEFEKFISKIESM
jgi:hypothetical protein